MIKYVFPLGTYDGDLTRNKAQCDLWREECAPTTLTYPLVCNAVRPLSPRLCRASWPGQGACVLDSATTSSDCSESRTMRSLDEARDVLRRGDTEASNAPLTDRHRA